MSFYHTVHNGEWNARSLTSLLLLSATPFIISWLVSTFIAWRALALARRTAPGKKRAPTLPSAFPYVGHTVGFLTDGHKFLSKAIEHFGPGVPVRIYLGNIPSYLLSGPETVAAFLKDSARGLAATTRSLKIMENAFGCPHELVDEFRPQVGDIEHQLHSALQGMLTGARLETLTERFQETLVHRVLEGDARMGDDWCDVADLCAFMENHIFAAATSATFGPYVVSLNPTIVTDFWEFNRHVKSLFMGLPRWINREAFRVRDKLTSQVKHWQRYAEQHCNIDEIDDEWEPYYGSKSTRIRQQLLTKRGIMNESARAAENLAFMWATNANSVPAAIWFLLETLRDPTLKPQVFDRLKSTLLTPKQAIDGPHNKPSLAFDIPKLMEDDLLQSIYSEVLRLRVAVLIVRQPTKDNFSVNGWHVKQEEVVSLSTRNQLMDKDFWNAGTPAEPHPLGEFWAERFIVNPKDPKSGPLREPRIRKTVGKADSPYFTLDGCTWSWVPYGGGRNLCPGRHFAKREIMLTAAIFLQAFDIELTGELPQPDESVFGFGTMPPNGKVPCRIRRRQM